MISRAYSKASYLTVITTPLLLLRLLDERGVDASS
jgi:hypothetical protein